ncbi:MAG: GNAT family N-acetyltransferase [Phenylobacterium sp.]
MDLIISTATRPDDAYMPIWAPLLAFNQQTVGEASGEPFALTITSPGQDAVLGGLWALSLWGSFYVALVVVPQTARGQGLGRALIASAEAEARSRNCRMMWLDTYAFQARAFYERLGFEVFGQIDGPAPVFPRYFMQKLLAA